MTMTCRLAFRSSAASAVTAPRSRRLCSSSKRLRKRWAGDRRCSWVPAFAGTSGRRAALLRRGLRQRGGIVIEDRRQPSLGLGQRLVLAPCVILDLVALDLADAEIIAFRMAEIEAAHRGARPHREAFGELDADRALAAKQREQGLLLSVIGLCRIAGRRPNAAIAFGDQFVAAQRLAGVV